MAASSRRTIALASRELNSPVKIDRTPMTSPSMKRIAALSNHGAGTHDFQRKRALESSGKAANSPLLFCQEAAQIGPNVCFAEMIRDAGLAQATRDTRQRRIRVRSSIVGNQHNSNEIDRLVVD